MSRKKPNEGSLRARLPLRGLYTKETLRVPCLHSCKHACVKSCMPTQAWAWHPYPKSPLSGKIQMCSLGASGRRARQSQPLRICPGTRDCRSSRWSVRNDKAQYIQNVKGTCLNPPRIGFKTHFGSDWLQSSWTFVFTEKRSRHASACLRALFTSGLAHELFVQSRLKSSFETSSKEFFIFL